MPLERGNEQELHTQLRSIMDEGNMGIVPPLPGVQLMSTGTPLTLTVSNLPDPTGRALYLYVFHINKDDQFKTLFPNRFDMENGVASAGSMSIPTEKSTNRRLYKFTVDPAKLYELERFWAIVSTLKYEDLPANFDHLTAEQIRLFIDALYRPGEYTRISDVAALYSVHPPLATRR